MRYAVYRRDNFDVRERGTYNKELFDKYTIDVDVLAERQKVGSDERNLQCLEAQNIDFRDKSEIFNYDMVEFVDGEIIDLNHQDYLIGNLLKEGKKVICRIWTKSSFKDVWAVYRDKISYLFSWAMPPPIPIPKSYAIIPPAVETDLFSFKRPIKNPRPLIIGYLGNLVGWKGHQLVEQAVHDLSDKGLEVELHLYGREDEKPMEHKSIKYNGIIPDRKGVAKAFKSFDIFCYPGPSTTDPDEFWFTSMEALSCGLPIIMLNQGSAKEYIDDNYNGFKVNQGHYGWDVGSKIKYYYENPELIIQHAYNSRIKAIEKFGPDVIVAKMTRFMFKLME